MAYRNILIFNMPVIQVYIVELYLLNRYNQRRDSMIIGFKDKETEKIYHQSFSKRFSLFIQRLALRKLMLLDNADSLQDLRWTPGNRLELLQGDRFGQYSLRINSQYRLCFKVKDINSFYDVEIIDYH
jgi:proteic killer suppression protein